MPISVSPSRNSANNLRAHLLFQVNLDCRMLMQEGTEILGQELNDRGGVRINVHVSLNPLTVFTQVRIKTLKIAEDVARMVQQGMPARSQCDSLGKPV